MAVVHVASPNLPPVSLDNREQLSLLCLIAWLFLAVFLVLVRGSLGSESKRS